ncbi:MAG: phosphoglycerate dehydrogenase [Planctomycetota bacterium]
MTGSESKETSFPKGQIRVLLAEGIHPRAAEVFAEAGYEAERVKPALTLDDLAARPDLHVLGVRSKTSLPAEALSAMPRLLAAGCFCIGTNHVDLSHARSTGVPIFNSPFSNTRSVAELTIAECVSLSRRLTERSAQMHEGVWRKSAAGAHEIRGKTLGIVGYGHIGTQVSILAEAMGMRVIYCDIVPKLPLGNASQVASLGELLSRSDFVTLHVPQTESTESLIGEREIASMKPGSFLINNARGRVVQMPALAAALRAGHLAGAALDVFPVEPGSGDEPFESELRGLANVILTPHIGGSTEEAQASIAEDVATKLVHFLDVGSTTGAVNMPEVELPSQAQADGKRPHRILHTHRNVPGVLSQLHGAISRLGVNVVGEYLRTDAEVGYVVLDVDPTDTESLQRELRATGETIRLRVLW